MPTEIDYRNFMDFALSNEVLKEIPFFKSADLLRKAFLSCCKCHKSQKAQEFKNFVSAIDGKLSNEDKALILSVYGSENISVKMDEKEILKI
tara:strand:- start:961 stop:1236 length:276 start_codon:yes stop_codon:yes gene_type:complete